MMTILDAMHDPALFGPWFKDRESWRAWEVALGATFGLPIGEDGAGLLQQCTGRTLAPTTSAREAWFIVGRRGGKSRIAALMALYLACFRDYSDRLAPGEVGTLPVIAADRASRMAASVESAQRFASVRRLKVFVCVRRSRRTLARYVTPLLPVRCPNVAMILSAPMANGW